ncbi:glycoside hydrolase family 95 protein [Paenibacillus psychroresistens]|uniref:Glycoside hydrolase family 95 protein n=1 Tax=Paenibacillus psychroresistens TaxID=1778678 RepID=A0A6B8RNF9_9BACL|nr:glycoside hydrolase family 95 protein [Paenibacillus psychroresistens]QGQ97242.1 glycoside hydrolase family 95 protein [Paenibacillus psychroresistens]
MKEWKLWYSQPALNWSQGLPLGNGRLGAVISGGVESETWHMTELTYWSGKAERTISHSNGKVDLEHMREQFFAGNYKQGEVLAKQALEPEKGNFGTNLSVCELLLQFEHQGEDLVRELDISNALATMAYKVNGKSHKRETFASHVDRVVVSHLSSEGAAGVSFTLGIEGSTEHFESWIEHGDTLMFKGKAIEKMHSDGECGVYAQGMVKVVIHGGTIQRNDEQIVIKNVDEAFIYYAVNTDYEKSDADWVEESSRQITQAVAKGYSQLKADHIADYRRLYDRVNLDLGHSERANLPTDERIKLLLNDQEGDPQLFALFFQFGRYLTIAGARADSPLPLNLQGIWNDGEANRMQWSCDYHLDINTEMNYFPTEVSNLAESHLPLMRYIERLSVAGKSTALDFYGCEGWVAHVFSNAWGFTAPGWGLTWGSNVTGGLWIATHLIEHYKFSLNQEFLEQQAYPIMKEAAAFFLDYMTIHPSLGYLVTGPSNSPENSFYIEGLKDTEHEHHLSMGSTLDQVLVRDLFVFCLEAAELLQVDSELQTRLKGVIALLPPLLVGKKGQLQEWLEDYDEAQPDHRHLSHLFSLYPGNQVTPQGTPELSAAARVTLENRMQREELEDVEFTVAIFAASFARLQDGENAYKHLSHLIGQLCFDNLLSFSKAGIAGAETNIFVIDGNFGGTAAVAEMLLQSHAAEIHLLPALPQIWHSGKFTGLRVKGNAEVDVIWEQGELVSATIRAFSTSTTFLRYQNQVVPIELEVDSIYTIDKHLNVICNC